MSLFSYLEGVKRKTAFDRGSEALFFGENSYLLSSHEPFQPYLHPKTPFQVARSNILIRAIVNKRVIERLYLSRAILAEKEGRLGKEEFMREAVLELPFLLLANGEKVYVPFFSRALNRIYAGDYGKMERMPRAQRTMPARQRTLGETLAVSSPEDTEARMCRRGQQIRRKLMSAMSKPRNSMKKKGMARTVPDWAMKQKSRQNMEALKPVLAYSASGKSLMGALRCERTRKTVLRARMGRAGRAVHAGKP